VRRLLGGVGFLVVGGFLVAALYWGPRFHRLAEVGAGYVAKQVCSCVFVGERDLAACRADIPESMQRVSASLLPDGEGVRASVLGLVERRATHQPGTGCTLH
jgi:hypothetical protein